MVSCLKAERVALEAFLSVARKKKKLYFMLQILELLCDDAFSTGK